MSKKHVKASSRTRSVQIFYEFSKPNLVIVFRSRARLDTVLNKAARENIR